MPHLTSIERPALKEGPRISFFDGMVTNLAAAFLWSGHKLANGIKECANA